ncbi:MAG TPA: hypothetical protein VMT52_09215 [Planctomycetota bacterium]|nr:hypothetical protein [Planctomycetota bacterium]
MMPGTLEICRRFEDFLPEILDLEGEGVGERGGFAKNLPPDEREALVRHATACERCAEALRAYRRTVEIIRDLPRHDAPPDFLGWVREATGARPPAANAPRKAGTGALPWRKAELLWISLAALLLVAVTAAFFLPPPREERPLLREGESALARMDADRADSPPDPAKPMSVPVPVPVTVPESVPSLSPSPTGPPPVFFTLEVSPEASPGALLALEADLRTVFERRPREEERFERSAEAPLDLRAKREAVPAAAKSAARGARARGAPSAAREVSHPASTPPASDEWTLQVPADQVEALHERLASWARDQGARVSTSPALRAASSDAAAASSRPLPLPSADFQARPEGESPVVEVRIVVRSR